MTEKKNVIKEKSFEFARQIVFLYKHLAENKKEFVMSRQMLRSGTAVGALVREAQNAESKADFIHKLGIAQKECDETIYWLELLNSTQFLTEEEFIKINNEAVENLKIIKRVIISTKNNLIESKK